MEITNNKIPVRFTSLDIMRGIAVLLMVEAHIRFSVANLTEWAYLFAAPSFIFIAGISYQLLIQSRERRPKKSPVYLEIFWRAVILFLITSAVTLIGNMFLHRDIFIFVGNIFLIISVGYLIGLLIHKNIKQKIIAIFIIFSLAYLIKTYHIGPLAFLTGHMEIIPGVCYFIAGQITFEAYKRDKLNLKSNCKLLIYMVAFLTFNLIIFFLFQYNFTIQGRDFFLEFLMISNILAFLAILLLRFVDLKNKFKRIFKPIENIGKISLTGYYISYIGFVVTGFIPLKSYTVILNLCLFVLAVLLLIALEKIWRPYNYILGFEWFLRKGTAIAMKYSPEKIRFPIIKGKKH